MFNASAHYLVYRVAWTSTAAISLSKEHSRYAPLYFRWMSCLISFVWHKSTCQELFGSEKMQNVKFLLKVWLEPTVLRSDDKKEEIWLSPMTNAYTPTEKSIKHRDNLKNRHQNFDYTTIADRLRTVSRSNRSHSTGVVNRFTGAQPSH